MFPPNSFLVFKKHRGGSGIKSPIIIVGKNVSKKATERNLLKRRIRAIARQFPFKDKFRFTIIARPGILDLSFRELKEAVFEKINSENG